MLQSGALCVGVGLGAGVGGEAGAEGRRLPGIVDAMGLLGVRICLGCDRATKLLFLDLEADAEAKEGGVDMVEVEPGSSSSDSMSKLRREGGSFSAMRS